MSASHGGAVRSPITITASLPGPAARLVPFSSHRSISRKSSTAFPTAFLLARPRSPTDCISHDLSQPPRSPTPLSATADRAVHRRDAKPTQKRRSVASSRSERKSASRRHTLRRVDGGGVPAPLTKVPTDEGTTSLRVSRPTHRASPQCRHHTALQQPPLFRSGGSAPGTASMNVADSRARPETRVGLRFGSAILMALRRPFSGPTEWSATDWTSPGQVGRPY